MAMLGARATVVTSGVAPLVHPPGFAGNTRGRMLIPAVALDATMFCECVDSGDGLRTTCGKFYRGRDVMALNAGDEQREDRVLCA